MHAALLRGREERQEAVAVIERDTAKTKLLNLSQETAAKCEVHLLLPFPQTTNPPHNTITTVAYCSAAVKAVMQPAKTHTHTHANYKSAQVVPAMQLIQ